MKNINIFFEDLFNLPRDFLAWLVFHAASWLDMKVIPNDHKDDIWEALEDIDIEDLDE